MSRLDSRSVKPASQTEVRMREEAEDRMNEEEESAMKAHREWEQKEKKDGGVATAPSPPTFKVIQVPKPLILCARFVIATRSTKGGFPGILKAEFVNKVTLLAKNISTFEPHRDLKDFIKACENGEEIKRGIYAKEFKKRDLAKAPKSVGQGTYFFLADPESKEESTEEKNVKKQKQEEVEDELKQKFIYLEVATILGLQADPIPFVNIVETLVSRMDKIGVRLSGDEDEEAIEMVGKSLSFGSSGSCPPTIETTKSGEAKLLGVPKIDE